MMSGRRDNRTRNQRKMTESQHGIQQARVRQRLAREQREREARLEKFKAGSGRSSTADRGRRQAPTSR